VRVIVINPQATEIDQVADVVVTGAAGVVLPALLAPQGRRPAA
jgi:NAD-dependent SIR2 family protein deacetylase